MLLKFRNKKIQKRIKFCVLIFVTEILKSEKRNEVVGILKICLLIVRLIVLHE